MTEADLRAAMKMRFETMTMTEWCRLTGCTQSHVSEFMRGLRSPPNDMLKALNLRVDYVRARKPKGLT